MEAKLFRLKIKDVAKSVTLFFITSVGGAVYSLINNGNFPTDPATWLSIAKASGLASGSYLIKNFLTNSKDGFMKKEVAD